MNNCITNRTPDYLRAHADIEHEHEFDIEGEGWKSERTRAYEGMTIRQQFVMAAMESLCSPALLQGNSWRAKEIAQGAIIIADTCMTEEKVTRK